MAQEYITNDVNDIIQNNVAPFSKYPHKGELCLYKGELLFIIIIITGVPLAPMGSVQWSMTLNLSVLIFDCKSGTL